MKYISVREQQRRKEEAEAKLRAKVRKNQADTDYIAMMTGVDLDDDIQIEEPGKKSLSGIFGRIGGKK